jgi:omega-6 fatty acid desaturase (delta-12 desaturase)
MYYLQPHFMLPLSRPLSSALSTSAPAFGPAEYLSLKRALATRPRTLMSVGVLVVMATLAALGLWLVERSWPEFLLSQVLFAIVFFQGFGLLHECGHSTASPRPAINAVIGHVASLFCFLPFYPWRFIHQAHHQWTGHLDKDPTLAAVRRWRRDGRVPPLVRGAWRSWIPLAALVQHVVFWSYPLRLFRTPGTQRRTLVRCALSVLFLGAAYAAFFWLGPVPPRHLVLAVLLYLVATEAVNIPHHMGTPLGETRLSPWEQWRSTRSCRYPAVLSELLVLNFNFHTEHHTFPFLPWYRLRAARTQLRAALGAHYREEVGVRWNLRHRTRSLEALVFSEDDAADPSPIATAVPLQAARPRTPPPPLAG